MPRTKRPAGTTADPRNGRRADVVSAAGALERFELPPYGQPAPHGDYTQEARDAWDAYWESGVSGMATPEDRVLLVAWIDAVDRAARLYRQADQAPEVKGYEGQPRPNGLYAVADRERSAALKLAAQLGIGPRNRADLGVAILTEQRTLQAVNAGYLSGGEDDDADDDPRRAVGG